MATQTDRYEKMLNREKKMVVYMVGIYCSGHHKTGNGLCPDCTQVKELVFSHLTNCPFQEKKSACGRCGLRCYAANAKATVEPVMTYAGPRMAVQHPGLALHHLWDGRRAPGKFPAREKKQGNA